MKLTDYSNNHKDMCKEFEIKKCKILHMKPRGLTQMKRTEGVFTQNRIRLKRGPFSKLNSKNMFKPSSTYMHYQY